MSHGDFTKHVDPRAGIAAYNQLNQSDQNAESDGGAVRKVYPPIRYANVEIITPQVKYGEKFTARIEIESNEDIDNPLISFSVFNLNEQPVLCWCPNAHHCRIDFTSGRQYLQFSIDPILLHGGVYRWCLQIKRQGSIGVLVWLMRAGSFTVVAPEMSLSDIPYIALTDDFQLDHMRESHARNTNPNMRDRLE
jgi:hypothetical protein